MRKPKYPGELLERAHKGLSLVKHRRKHHLTSPLTGLKEGSPEDVKKDKEIAAKLGKHKKTTPKTAKGKAMVKKLGRTKKTGGFNKIAKAASKEYGSKEAGKKVAGSIFWKMAKGKGKHKTACKKDHKHHKVCYE